ncbi:MAG: SpoIID/LytB domain-containing protein [Cyanobium sp.]
MAVPALLLLAGVPLAGGARMGSSQGGMAAERPIRVLLREAPLSTVGAAGHEGLELRDQTGRSVLKVQPGRQLRIARRGETIAIEPVPGGPGVPSLDSSVVLGEGPEPKPLPPLPLQDLRLEPIDPQGLLVLKQRRYRGTLLLRPEGQGLQAINRLPLESYLAGVVGSEMPGSWPLAALKAQAVASRTYALQQLRPKAPFDLKATVASQVYKGVETESVPVRQAVASTRSRVLMHGQHLINAVFHSSSGGITENSGDLWSRQLPYLVSVPDFDNASPVSRWEKAISPEALRQAFAETGGVTTIEAIESSRTGRVRQVKVVGPLGELVLTGSALRQRLGLRSTLVQFHLEPAERLEIAGGAMPETPPGTTMAPPPAISPLVEGPRLVVKGRGYGHGVGMSQWGAYALALQGKSYEDILRYYYRGAVLRTF